MKSVEVLTETRSQAKGKEALVYEFLLKNGASGAGIILKHAPYKRGDLYNILYSLRDMGLIEQFQRRGRSLFRANHPNSVDNMVESRLKKLEATKKELDAVIPSLSSIYNLAYHKPGVKVFEGKDSVKKIMNDSLKSKSEILSYVDVETIEKHLSDLNREYIKKRHALQIQKRILVTESPYNKKYFSKLGPTVTDVRYMNFPMEKFSTVMQIYDNKVSYFVIVPGRFMGIVIEDKYISSMHRSLFEYTWSVSTKTN